MSGWYGFNQAYTGIVSEMQVVEYSEKKFQHTFSILFPQGF
jgi:hypothetical protein